MGRIIAAAVLGASCLAASAVAGEYEPFTHDALGVTLNVPPGYEAEEAAPAEGTTVTAVRLSWPEGPHAGLEALITRREAAYANVVIWAGFYQRRLGASSSFEVDGEILGEAELAAAGADDGLRNSYVVGEQEGRRRLEVLFLTSGNNLYVVELSHPEVVENRLAAAAREMLSSIEILPPVEDEPPEVRDSRDAGMEPPPE
ncbi:MAG TPA: hypothetical protein VMX79_08585 [bacterium]|nr:hypothetical protein [bacterium]